MNIYCNVCNKYRKSEKTKTLYIFKKTLDIILVSVVMDIINNLKKKNQMKY